MKVVLQGQDEEKIGTSLLLSGIGVEVVLSPSHQ